MSRGCTECSRNLKVYESSSGFLYLAWELYCTCTAFLMINSRKPQSWLMTYVVKYWCNLYSNAKDIQIPKSHAWNSLTSVSHKSLPSDSKQLVPFKRSPFVRKSCRITWDAMVLTLNYTAICLHKQNYNTASIFSRCKWSGWRDGLVLKNTHSSCRDPECRSQHPGQITHNRLQFHLQGVYCLCRHLHPQACAAGTKLYIQINIFFFCKGEMKLHVSLQGIAVVAVPCSLRYGWAITEATPSTPQCCNLFLYPFPMLVRTLLVWVYFKKPRQNKIPSPLITQRASTIIGIKTRF